DGQSGNSEINGTLTTSGTQQSSEDKQLTQSGNLYTGDYNYSEAVTSTFHSDSTQDNQGSHSEQVADGGSSGSQSDQGNKKAGNFDILQTTSTTTTTTATSHNQSQSSSTVTVTTEIVDSEKSGSTTSGNYNYHGITTDITSSQGTMTNGLQTDQRTG